MTEGNKAAVRDYLAGFNAFDMARMRGIFADTAQIWGVMGSGGLDVAEPVWCELHECLEMRIEAVEMIAEGACVAALLRETGRFVRPFRGMPGIAPTGRTYSVVAMEWFHFDAEGRIDARWGARDSATIFRQLTGG